ncbi:uncharacterized protein BDZ99DRAFT_479654 [Mytilinidion resinicola]|uniref:Plasmid pRiA4b Orf3-like domain-containing protein n=1 Tax=Mytilinidion resinicola TaxID=574789 RepID=A0A6A6YEW2_9PEZI|nr:uncharacterized protein BDZ99DRAFT_479654 [Mytilinidion resinicola]KAF2806397.1 hypothetical protein BDZ99DRAFT_479654 [Mytilinidion resinicola]
MSQHSHRPKRPLSPDPAQPSAAADINANKRSRLAPPKPAAAPNYLFHITIPSERGIGEECAESPARTLSIPAAWTFHQFHEAIQVAFYWSNTQAYQFNVCEPGSAHSLRVVSESVPRLHVSAGGAAPFGVWEDSPSVESTLKIDEVFNDYKWAAHEYEYKYHPAVPVTHRIKPLGRAVATSTGPECIAGEFHAAPEGLDNDAADDLRAAFMPSLLNETADEKRAQARMRRWYRAECVNGDTEGLAGARLIEYGAATTLLPVPDVAVGSEGKAVDANVRVVLRIAPEIVSRADYAWRELGSDTHFGSVPSSARTRDKQGTCLEVRSR